MNLWMILLIGGIGSAITYFVVEGQTEIYESQGSIVVMPTLDADAIPRPIQSIEIAVGTYVQVLRSQQILNSVWEVLENDYPMDKLSDIEIEIQPVNNSSIIIVIARADDPLLAQVFANALIQEMINDNPLPIFNIAYPIEMLDSPELPKSPSLPNKKVSLVFGALGSLTLGVMAAFLFDTYVKIRRRRPS